MTRRGAIVEIVGAGPAGLAAAITAARRGAKSIVYERAERPGSRFQGDFQGLENWTTRRDVLTELNDIGIVAGFEHVPVRELVVWVKGGHEYRLRSEQPLFYLVRRGDAQGTLDTGLVRQAETEGVEIRWGERVAHLPEGGIVADGPRRADAVAVGYVFATDQPDGCYAALAEELAPGGYAYLLMHGGRGTLATCLFRDFHREAEYLGRTRAFFEDRLCFRLGEAERFGGVGNAGLPATALRGKLLLTGEAAGFQDALWGFGMRYAALSGHLAARAWIAGSPALYDRLWRDRFAGAIRVGVVNRFLYERSGEVGYRALTRRLAHAPDVREWMRRQYAPRGWKRALYPLAGRSMRRAAEARTVCGDEGCDCTWCRCTRQLLAGGRVDEPRGEPIRSMR